MHPAEVEEIVAVIAVGSTTQEDSRSWFSNFGCCVSIWAPVSKKDLLEKYVQQL